jgi:hypothetical protein
MPPESLVIQATLQRPRQEYSAASSLNTLPLPPPQLLWVSLQLSQRQFSSSRSSATPYSINVLRENWEDGKKALEILVDNQISILWSEGPLDLDLGKGKVGTSEKQIYLIAYKGS